MKKTYTLLAFLLTFAYTFAQGGFSYSGGYTVHQTSHATGTDYGHYGYSDGYGTATGCALPMHPAEFERAFATIACQPFSSDKLTIANQILTYNILTADQIARIVSGFAFSRDRETFAKQAWHKVCDPQNYYLVLSTFTFSSTIRDVERYMACNPRPIGACCACPHPVVTCGGPGVCGGCGTCAAPPTGSCGSGNATGTSYSGSYSTSGSGYGYSGGYSTAGTGHGNGHGTGQSGGYASSGASSSGGYASSGASTSGGYASSGSGNYNGSGTGHHSGNSNFDPDAPQGNGSGMGSPHTGNTGSGFDANGVPYGPAAGSQPGTSLNGTTNTGSSSTEFGPFLNTLNAQSSESRKLSIAKNFTQRQLLPTSKIRRIMKEFSQESTRLEYAKFAYRFCADKQNFLMVTDDSPVR